MENLLQTIREERARFGATMSHDECARLCNAVAWRHRAQGFGLSAKSSGTYGTLPNGTRIAHDILHHLPSNELVDILTAAGAESQPQWSPVGPPQSADRVFVAPVDPRPIETPTAPWSLPPVPMPVGPTTTDVLVRLDTLAQAIDVIATRLSVLDALPVIQQQIAQAQATANKVHASLAAGVPVTLQAKLIGRVTGTVGGQR